MNFVPLALMTQMMDRRINSAVIILVLNEPMNAWVHVALNHTPYQGSKKVPSGCPGQVDFPVGQVTFHSHLPNGQGPRQIICQLTCKKGNLRLAQGKQVLRATCPKGKLEFKFFFKP